jgi:exopolysaccharide biosynthesis polyprenyl glycosylphosphotransferase
MATARIHSSTQNAWVILMDLLCLVLGSVVGVTLRLGREEIGGYVLNHLDGWLIFVAGVMLANYLAGSYRLQHVFSRFDIIVTWIFSLIFALLVLSITSYAWFRLLLGRGVLFMAVASYSAFSLLFRMAIFRTIFRSELFLCRTAILGTRQSARRAASVVGGSQVMPLHRVMAYIELTGNEKVGEGSRVNLIDGVAVLRVDRAAVDDIVRSLNVGLIVVAPEDSSEIAQIHSQLRRLRFEGVEVLSITSLEEIYNGKIPLDTLTEESLMQLVGESGMPIIHGIKRVFDVVVSLVFGVLLLPVTVVVALLIKASAPRSGVFYSQLRVGHFGRVFRIYKFRTMREDAESGTGPVWASADDPRITVLGKVLRRLRLDEIPQLLNVLKGDMSLVGPRPERPEISEGLIKRIPYFSERQNVLPGLSGWAQIRYPYGSSVDDARRKLEYDLYYIKHLSLRLDIQIILSTLRIVIFGNKRSY